MPGHRCLSLARLCDSGDSPGRMMVPQLCGPSSTCWLSWQRGGGRCSLVVATQVGGWADGGALASLSVPCLLVRQRRWRGGGRCLGIICTSLNGHDTQAERSTDLCHGTGNVQASGVGLGIERMREEDQKLVPSAVERSDFSLWRSLRRGAVLETTTHKVDVQVIELINRWRKKEAARGSEAGLPMRQVYTQVRSALPIMKEFSRAL